MCHEYWPTLPGVTRAPEHDHALPVSALLPGISTDQTSVVFTKLQKAAIVTNGYNLNATEVGYLQNHGSDFGSLDFNAISLNSWKSLDRYTSLRNSLPQTSTTLIDFFTWASGPNSTPADLVTQMTAVTLWTTSDAAKISSLISSTNFNIASPTFFKNEINFIKIQKALAVSDKIQIDVNTIFSWVQLPIKFWPSISIAENIRKLIRARFSTDDYESVMRPLNNTIREDQKNALIAYLLTRPELRNQGVIDADSLFEFFMIDVQMSSCLQTSRIKQAISTVQVFVQRCLLGLEPGCVVDRARWDSMQSQPLCVARRKVFLYPEQWIQESLRDDESPFYVQLESDLLQKDITLQTATDAYKKYLYSLDQVARLKVEGLYFDPDAQVLHICARSNQSPYNYFYRTFDTKNVLWYPWQSMQVDIPNYSIEDSNNAVGESGTYMTPVVYYGRVIVFFLQMSKKSQPIQSASTEGGTNLTQIGNNLTPTTAQPPQFWEITLCWTEYRDGTWTPKQLAVSPISEVPTGSSSTLPPINGFMVVPTVPSFTNDADGTIQISIDIYRSTGTKWVGRFYFSGGQLTTATNVSPTPALPTASQVASDFQYETADKLTTDGSEHFHSLQYLTSTTPELDNFQFPGPPYVISYPPGDAWTSSTFWLNSNRITFSHDFVHQLLGKLTSTENLDDVFAFFEQYSDVGQPFGQNAATGYNELAAPNALYNWELAFHIPMAIVNQLRQASQFDNALKMLQYVFDPLTPPDPGAAPDPTRFWKFKPFQYIASKDYLEDFFNSLQPHVLNPQID